MQTVTYIGTKEVRALPMSRQDYNDYRGWTVPDDEDPTAEGYLVVYPGESQPNGKPYESWSPKATFENSYSNLHNLDFGKALIMAKKGARISRTGWGDYDMWVIYVPGTENVVPSDGTVYARFLGSRAPINILPHLDMKSANGDMIVGWLASQADICAEDWVVL